MNTIITWFYAEHKGDESFYPSVGGNTSSPEFQKVYWRCVYAFYQSALLTQPKETKYMFFTNVPNLPTELDGVNISDFMEKNKIEVCRRELSNRTPKDWHNEWRNQFYVFDVLEALQEMEGNFLILDSDILLRKSLAPLFDAVEQEGIVTYDCKDFDDDHHINGPSNRQMRELYAEYYGEPAESLRYKGGEFIGINHRMIAPVLEEYRRLWKLNYRHYEEKKTKLNEEAHFLTLIYHRLGITNTIANQYTRRMWSSLRYDNIQPQDAELAIWHLPGEKKYGFRVMFNWFRKNKFTEQKYQRKVSRVMGIPGSATYRRTLKAIRRAKEKMGLL